jgi:Fic family protein
MRQPSGYRAFMPTSLPPEPPIRLSDDLITLLSHADRALGRLDGSIQTLPNPDPFVAMYVRKEAVLSSQIEGTQSSLQDVLAAEAKVLAADSPSDVDEVFNCIRAMKHGLQLLQLLPVSVRLIRESHERLLEGVRGQHLTPGELRTTQNWIGPPGCTLADATFVPPPPHELSRLLGELERFLHDETPLPLLVRIGLAHAQFETIHPFLDGNGRVGRLLITFLLCEKELLLKPVLYLSHYFMRHRQEYYGQLQAIRDRGTWEEWLTFFLTGVREVSNHGAETARRMLSLRELHRQAISDSFGRAAANGHRILEHLYAHPFISVTEAQDLTKTSFAAANSLITQFVTSNILQEITGQKRHRRFRYSSFINLFHDEPPVTSF